nr:DUF6318 family protein [Kribbella kalugense]
MTHRNRPTTTLLACLGAATLLTACGGSPEAGRPNTAPPTGSTGAESSVSTQPSPGGTTPPTSTVPTAAPDRPSTAQGVTLAAAEQFVRYYSDLMNYAADTGDTTTLLAASDSGCENCNSYAAFIAKSNATNGLLVGDYHEHITDVPELTRGKTGFAGGSATLSVGGYTSKETKADAPLVSKPSKYTREFALSTKGGNWIMYEMKQTKQ